jgi:tRNA threonylcarbamoyladenosine biosynthesis protein TsaB
VKLLALDTATELCSAALWLDGRWHELDEVRARGHGELVLPMIERLLAETGLRLQQLDAIAFGRGPGAFTGVRLAVSVAQGLGFSVGLPLIPISDLRAIAAQAMGLPQAPARVLVCQDARMGEVYWGCFERSEQLASPLGHESVSAPTEVLLPPTWSGAPVSGAGSGFLAYPTSLVACTRSLSDVFERLRPRAREIASLAARDGLAHAVPPELAQPVYLRDEVARIPGANSGARRSRN